MPKIKINKAIKKIMHRIFLLLFKQEDQQKTNSYQQLTNSFLCSNHDELINEEPPYCLKSKSTISNLFKICRLVLHLTGIVARSKYSIFRIIFLQGDLMNKMQKEKKRIQNYIAYFRKLEIELKSKLMVEPSANSD